MRNREQWSQGHRSEVVAIRGFVVFLIGSAITYFGPTTFVQGVGTGVMVFGLMQAFPKSQTWMLPMISGLVRRLKLPFLSDPVPDQPEDEGEVHETGTCQLCGKPMPPGEEVFMYHGHSGPCPE